MALDEFDFVVLGDEPAGLWCLQKLTHAPGQGIASPKLAWVSLREKIPPVAVPVRFAARFELPVGASWHGEIVTPAGGFTWSPESIRQRFPELPARFFESHGPGEELRFGEREMIAIRYALRQKPELLAYASGIWKAIGRTRALHAERLVAGALLGAELAWWKPDGGLVAGIRRISIDARKNPIEEIQVLKNGTVAIRFVDREPIVSRQWILSAQWHALAVLDSKARKLLEILNIADELRAAEGLLPLTIRVDRSRIPLPLGPLTLWFSHDDIPDVSREILPLQCQEGETDRELTLWASVPRELALDTALERFREGMARVHPLLPFLSTGKGHYSVPLGMESCFSDEQRDATLTELERLYVEHYDFTSLHTETRLKGVTALLPSHRCDLPYPMGALHGAQQVVAAHLGRKGPPPKPTTVAAEGQVR